MRELCLKTRLHIYFLVRKLQKRPCSVAGTRQTCNRGLVGSNPTRSSNVALMKQDIMPLSELRRIDTCHGQIFFSLQTDSASTLFKLFHQRIFQQ